MTETPATGPDLPPEGKEPEIDPDVTVIEARGEKKIGFKGMKHLQMPEPEKDKIHKIYRDIIIEFDQIKDEYTGVDRAWHLGRVMTEYDVRDDDEMTVTDLGAYNTIEDMYARRLSYARHIHAFWPRQKYDPRHSVSALGELASRASNSDRTEEASLGYTRILDHDEELIKWDVLAWDRIESDPSIDDIVECVTEHYKTPSRIAESVKRVTLLLDQPLSSLSDTELRDSIRAAVTGD